MDSTSSPSNSTAGLPGSPLHAIRAHSVTEAVNAALHGQPSSVLPDNDELAHVIRRVPLQPLGHIDPDRINTLAADIYQAQQQQQQSQPQHQEQQQQEQEQQQQEQEQQHQQQGQSGGSNRQQQTDDDYMMPELLAVSDSSTEDSDEEREDATDDDGAGDDGSVPSLHDLSDSSDEEDDDYESEEEEAEAAAVAAAPPNEPMPRDSMWAAMPAVFTPLAPRNNPTRPGFLQMMNQLIFESAADATDTTRAEELMRGLEPVSAELARRFVRAGGEAMCAVCREDLVSGGDDAVTPLTSVPDLSSPADAVRSPVQYLDASAHRGPPMPFEQRTPPATSADVLALPCHHAFHAACLHPWLARRTTCPTCRLDLDPESLTLRMPIATAGPPVSPELLDILGSPIPLNDGSGRSVFLPPSPEQLQRVGTHNAALFDQAQRLQAGQMRAQAAGQPATPASTQNSTLIERAQPRLQAEQMRARTAGQPATPASPPSGLQMRFQTPPRPALVQHDPALLEQVYRVQMERLALLNANNSVPSTSPAGPTPGLQMGTALAQTARNLSNVQQDLARVAAMLPRLEESMRTLSALTEEHIAQHHAASEDASAPPEAAATPSEPTDAPPAPSDPAPVPAPTMSDPAPAPGPVDPTSAPAPPQPAAIEGSLLDNDHLRFMLGATVPPAPSPASSLPQRTDGNGTPLAPENLHVPPPLTMPGVPPPMRADLSNTRSMAVERDFQARLAVLRAYGPGALMDVDLPSLIDEDSALAEALVVEDEWDNARTAELPDGMGTVAAHAAPPWPPFAAGAAEDAQAHTAADGDGDAQAFQAQTAGDGDTSASHAQTPAHGRRGWRIRRASSGLAAAHLVSSWRTPASSSAAADRNIDDSAASASIPIPAADAPSAASTSTPTPPAQVDTPVAVNAASGTQSTLPTSDQVQVRRSVAALDAERRSIEAQLEAARRTQQELLDRLRQEQTLNAARRIGRVVRPAAQDTGPQSAAARAFHMLRAAGTGTGTGTGTGAPPAAPEPRKKWVCPPPKGGMSLLAWVAQREGEAGEGEKEDVVRVLAVPRPRESSEGA